MVNAGKYTIHGCHGKIHHSESRWRSPLPSSVAKNNGPWQSKTDGSCNNWPVERTYQNQKHRVLIQKNFWRKTQASPSFVGQSNFKHITNNVKKKNISSNWSVGIFSGWTHRVRNQWYTRSISIPFIPLLKGGFLDILYGNNWTLGRKKAAKNLVGLLVKTSHFRCGMILESSSSGFQPTNQPTNQP